MPFHLVLVEMGFYALMVTPLMALAFGVRELMYKWHREHRADR